MKSLSLQSIRVLMCLLASLAWAAEPPPAATLQIRTDPPEAEVYLNGRLRGSSPLTLAGLGVGEHLVTLRKPGYLDFNRTVSLEAQTRYPLQVALEALKGLMLVHSVPPGAEVTIGGATQGLTPLLITTLPLGTHRVRLTAPGFQPKEIVVELVDRTPRRVVLDLASDSGTLVLTSTPTNAVVLVNGIQRGVTPCTIERIPEGEIAIEVRQDGYLPFQQRVKLAAGEVQNLDVPLAPRPATLRIVSIPDGGRVYLDNQFRGEAPVTLEELSPGSYRVRVEKAGCDPAARTLELGRGVNQTEEFRLVANTGRIEVTTEPAGVTVFVNGQKAGETPAQADETTRVSTTLAIEALAAGNCELRLVRKGFFEKIQTVALERGKTATLHVALERRFIPDYEVTTARGVYRGVLDSTTAESVRLETAPGVITAILLKDITSRRPLRDE